MPSVAIMQPYFLPYLGYFSLIAATDQWIFFDTAQYIRHGWINRNRILKPSKDDWQYIIVSLEKHSRDIAIKDVMIKQNSWQMKILAQLEHYKKKAPYYNDVVELVRKILFSIESQKSLVQLNTRAVQEVCIYCGLDYKGDVFSEMPLKIGKVNAPDEWALEISKAIGADTYVNPSGGMEFFDQSKYKAADIELRFLRNRLHAYPQANDTFIAGLSIIDALMFCSATEVREMILDFEWL